MDCPIVVGCWILRGHGPPSCYGNTSISVTYWMNSTSSRTSRTYGYGPGPCQVNTRPNQLTYRSLRATGTCHALGFFASSSATPRLVSTAWSAMDCGQDAPTQHGHPCPVPIVWSGGRMSPTPVLAMPIHAAAVVPVCAGARHPVPAQLQHLAKWLAALAPKHSQSAPARFRLPFRSRHVANLEGKECESFRRGAVIGWRNSRALHGRSQTMDACRRQEVRPAFELGLLTAWR